jgi:hypothetical protein
MRLLLALVLTGLALLAVTVPPGAARSEFTTPALTE